MKKGMEHIYYGPHGTAPNLFNGAPYTAAGKTGTAQSAYYGDDRSKYGMASVNLTHVGYAPAESLKWRMQLLFRMPLRIAVIIQVGREDLVRTCT